MIGYFWHHFDALHFTVNELGLLRIFSWSKWYPYQYLVRNKSISMIEITLDPVPIVSTIEQFLKNRFLSSQPTHSDRIQRLYRQREMPRPILTQGPPHISFKTRYYYNLGYSPKSNYNIQKYRCSFSIIKIGFNLLRGFNHFFTVVNELETFEWQLVLTFNDLLTEVWNIPVWQKHKVYVPWFSLSNRNMELRSMRTLRRTSKSTILKMQKNFKKPFHQVSLEQHCHNQSS